MILILAMSVLILEDQRTLVHNVLTRSRGRVELSLSVVRQKNGAARGLRLRAVNRCSKTIDVPSLVTSHYFLSVVGVPFKSGDIISSVPRYPDYGFTKVEPNSAYEWMIKFDDLLGPRAQDDGVYHLGLTYIDSWSKHPNFGSVHLGSVRINKRDSELRATLSYQMIE